MAKKKKKQKKLKNIIEDIHYFVKEGFVVQMPNGNVRLNTSEDIEIEIEELYND